jgi:hypothetical protein
MALLFYGSARFQVGAMAILLVAVREMRGCGSAFPFVVGGHI